MSIQWFTQPGLSYASFYLFYPESHKFCRIRLEQNHADGHGTFASYKSYRAVGFSDRVYPTGEKSLPRWSINDQHQLVYSENILQENPEAGFHVYDSTDPTKFVHIGNPVNTDPFLPKGVTAQQLEQLAQLVIRNQQGVILLAKEDHSKTLAQAIADAIALLDK
jgi:hypothetical protein